MRTHQPPISRSVEVTPRQSHVNEQLVVPRPHPIIALQQKVGNQAVLRTVVRRESDKKRPSLREQAEQYIRQRIEYRDQLIQRALDAIENNLGPKERTAKLPIVHNEKMVHQATGILTLGMIENLQKALMPLEFAAGYIHQQLEYLWKDVKFKDEMLEALEDDPVQWQIDDMKRLSDYKIQEARPG